MHSDPNIEAEQDEPDAQVAALRVRQVAMLQELAEIGMQISRAVRDEALIRVERAKADAPASSARSPFGADLGLVYSRIARAVQQTLALQTRVVEGIAAAKAELGRARQATIQREATDREDEIRDYVAQAIEAEAIERGDSEAQIGRLLDHLDERLDAGAYDDDLADGPIGDLIERICKDLGVTVDWHLFTAEPWYEEYEASLPPYNDIGAERWTRDPPPDSS